MSCVVPGCKSNYRCQAESTYENLELREEWFGAIPHPRKDYANTQMRVSFYNYVSFTDCHIYTSTHRLGMCTSFQTG